VNLLGFLQGDERWMSVSNCQTADAIDFLLVGSLLAEAIAASDRKVMLLASGAMSHTFHPLREIRKHESSDPSHIFSPEARTFDERILAWWANGDHGRVVDSYDDYRRFRPEGRFGHYLTMLGAIGGRDCTAVGVPFSSYENAVGTAQIHVNFERPTGGWTR
jgi:3,4-dihydroxyphenylacetate 2,3-dioxygenase